LGRFLNCKSSTPFWTACFHGKIFASIVTKHGLG
jgi:hypothetical protein